MRFLILVTLTAFASIAHAQERVEGELRIEFYSFAGSKSPGSAQFSRFQLTPEKKLIQEMNGIVSDGLFIPTAHRLEQIPIHPLLVGQRFPETVNCSDLMSVKAQLPYDTYEKRGVVDKVGRAKLEESNKKLVMAALSFIDVKSFTRLPPKEGELYVVDESQQQSDDLIHHIVSQTYLADQMQGGRFVSQSPDKWRRVGSARMAVGQIEGQTTPLPFVVDEIPGVPPPELGYALDIELGQLAVKDGTDLNSVLTVAAQRIRVELIARNLDATQVMIYGHAGTPEHIRLYRMAGMKLHGQRPDGNEGVLKMRADQFLKLFDPGRLGFGDASWMSLTRPLSPYYETYVWGNNEPPIHLQFFGDGWRKGVNIAADLDEFMTQTRLTYHPEDVLLMRHYFMDYLGLDSTYFLQRMMNSSLFRMDRFLKNTNMIKVTMPGRPSLGNLVSQFTLSLLAVEHQLKTRYPDATDAEILKLIEAMKLKFAYFTNDRELLGHMRDNPELGQIGLELHTFGTASQRNPALIWVDLPTLYDRYRIKKEFTMVPGTVIHFGSEETSIRAGADLH